MRFVSNIYELTFQFKHVVDKRTKAEASLKFHDITEEILKQSKPSTEFGFCGLRLNLPYQHKVLTFYQHSLCVYFWASLIVSNFVINVVEKEIDPTGTNYTRVWADLDTAFNVMFLFELLINMYAFGGPFRPFWSSWWNVFDFIIVTVGMLLVTNLLGDAFSKLKLLRAFRVFRLFKRIESLNKIIVALVNAIPGVLNGDYNLNFSFGFETILTLFLHSLLTDVHFLLYIRHFSCRAFL